ELEAIKRIPPTPRLHPSLAEIYARKVAQLDEVLNDPETQAEAAEVLRGPIDEIRLSPALDDTTLRPRSSVSRPRSRAWRGANKKSRRRGIDAILARCGGAQPALFAHRRCEDSSRRATTYIH